MRPHQWMKNLLVFVPLVTSHQWGEQAVFMRTLVTFVSFCLGASAVYAINDCVDVEADRMHPEKQNRPIAAGTVGMTTGILLALFLLLVSFCMASFVGIQIVICIGIYVLITTAYSFALKKRMIVDVITLTCLFMIRIVTGGVAADAPLSQWLFAFGSFTFLSLALAKRYTELVRTQFHSPEIARRGYRLGDVHFVAAAGLASAFSATLVLSLYLSSDTVAAAYKTPELLWVWLPLILYWFLRLWLITSRGELTHDPVAFAARDWVTHLIAGVTLTTLVIAARIEIPLS